MSKNTSKRGANDGTPKNTLFNYFSRSPATAEKKKIPKTPSQQTDPVDEKENLKIATGAVKTPKEKTGARPSGPRKLDDDLKKVSKGEKKIETTVKPDIIEQNKEEKKKETTVKPAILEDDIIASSGRRIKRRRIVIPDFDSSDDEHEAKKRNVFVDSDDDDRDEDFKASSDSGEESEDDIESVPSNEVDDENDGEEEDEDEQDEKSKNFKRTDDAQETRNNAKLKVIKEEIELSKGTISEKLESIQQFANDDEDIEKDEKYDEMLSTTKDEGYEEPVVWPHQKLEFLKPENIKDKKGRRPDHPNYDESTLYVPPKFLDGLSPGVRQWWILKSDNFDCVIFFKVGKFYELYHMDADVGVNELGFTYMRGEFAHSGFPEVSFDKMASILVERGYKIARVEQTETPDMMAERCKKTKSTKFDKVVRREICQIMNRGTRVYGSQCEISINHQPSYMLALVEKSCGANSRYGISFIDTSIGDFYIGEFSDDKNCSRLLTLLSHNMPVLVIYEKSSLSERTQNILRTMLANVLKETIPNSESQQVTAEKTLKYLANTYYSTGDKNNWPAALRSMQNPIDRLGYTPHAEYKLAIKAMGQCIEYMRKCLLEEKIIPMARFNLYVPPDIVNAEENKKRIEQSLIFPPSKYLVLDGTTLTHLRIIGEEHSLLSTIDHCCTKFGKRLLHNWVCSPSCDCDVITERQQAISELVENYGKLQDTRKIFAPLPDIERQLAQIHLFGSKVVAQNHPDGRAILFEEKQYNKKKLRNFIALLDGFKSLENSIPKLFRDCKSPLLKRLTQYPIAAGQEWETDGGIYPRMKKPLEFFETSFDNSAAAETGIIAPEKGIDVDFDATERKIEAVQKKIKAYLEEQENYFGCKLSYFGSDKKRFQIEVPEKRTHKATAEYQLEGQRKGSNPVKRYTTDTTRGLLREMQNAEEERNRVVKDLSRRIFEKFSSFYDIWKQCFDCIAYLDVLGSLAEYAYMQRTICVPVIHPPSSKPYIDIKEGYHPCMPADSYIPNSIILGVESNAPLALLSGPNMGGKSTFMRQVGLLLVLAQIGSHVPAESCELTIIDRIFTRLGAQDDILAGQSTFMLEMSEASLILKHATLHSFVLMDELGRGTATYDGTAIAASVVNYLAQIGCRTMFSTHYKNLTDHYGKDSRIQLGHMACMVENEDNDDPTEETVTFLYKYSEGACPKSYGFNAAKLGGMPHDIIKRAYELSKEVEATALTRKITAKIVSTAVGKSEVGSATENNINTIKNLLLQLKSCRI